MIYEQAYKIMFKEYPDVLGISELSRLLGVSTKTVYKLLKENRIGFLKVGREYKIPKINVIRYLLKGSTIDEQTCTSKV